MKKFFLLVALLSLPNICGSECLAAEERDTASTSLSGCLNLGLGVGSWRGDLAGNFGAGISANRGRNLVTLRFLYNSQFELHIFGQSHPDDHMWELGVLYGRIAKTSYGHASISAGLSVSSATTYSEPYYRPPSYTYGYDTNNSFGIGIPVEAQLFWTPTSFLGIGLTAFGDYGFGNTRSFWGITLCLQLGMMR